jgi:formylglycine-generating enzyme required for sulfatase activity
MQFEDSLGLVGTTVADKYLIERVVGQGGFAVVYRAQHTIWKKPVALKCFKALMDVAPSMREQLLAEFVQEGALLTELSARSAHIVQARDVGTLETASGHWLPYMVLEWLDGETLDARLARDRADRAPEACRWSVTEAMALLEPVAAALEAAHRRSIAHRDVKPANVFVLGDPRGEHTTKVLDFGIAKVVQDAQRLAGSFAQTQGVVSSFTPAYGAPEQFSRTHGATGPWTDVFAMGLIFSELVTNEAPLRGDDLTQLAFAAMDPHRRPTPRTLGAAVPDALETVLRRALAVSPDERYRDMGELWNALRGALSMEPMAPASGTDPNPAAVAAPLPPVQETTRGAPPAARTSSVGTFVGAGLGVLVAAGAIATAVYLLAIKGKEPIAPRGPDTVAASSTSAAPPVPAPPPPECPSEMAKIPGGKFFMGTDDKNDEERERPAHQVTLSPYCIDRTEVTVAQYKECSDKGECKRAPRENEWEGITAAARKIYDPLCTVRDPEANAQHPINCIDWELATAFCTARGKRLPTEAEWEFATRGSDGRKYPWGDDVPTTGGRLNACGKECVAWGKKHPDPENPLEAMYPVDDGFPTTAPVGSFPQGDSPFGLHDVVGNVWEWTSDWYGPYGSAAEIDPRGAASGKLRILRGGAWNGSDPAWVRPTFRFMAPPALRSHGIGFRCAMPLVAADR